MANDLSTSLQALLVDFLKPLDEVAGDTTALTEWLAALGYTSGFSSDPALLQVAQHGQAVLATLQAFDAQTLESTDGLTSLLAAGREAGTILQELRTFGADPARTQVASGLADEVMSFLLASHLRRNHPTVFRVASLLTLIDTKELAQADAPIVDGNGATMRYGRVLDRFKFGTIDSLIRQPGATLNAAYLPNGLANGNDAWTAAQRLFPNLSLLADVLGLSSSTEFRPNLALSAPSVGDGTIMDVDPTDDPSDFPPVVIDDSGGAVPSVLPAVPDAYFAANDPVLQLTIAEAGVTSGLALQILAASKKHPSGVAGLILQLVGTFNRTETRGPWKLTFTSSGTIPALSFGPDGLALGPGGNPPAKGTAKFVVERIPAPGSTGPTFVFGSPKGTRLELGSLGITGDVSFDPSSWSASLGVAASSGALVIAAGDADSFLSSLLPSGELKATFDLGLAWSNGKGLTFHGSAGLDTDIPIGFALGPVTLVSVHLGLQTQATGAVSAEVSASLSAAIGPVRAVLDRVGMTGAVTFPPTGGNLGVADLDLGFKGPSGIGLSIDAQGVLTGGGFLFHDEAQGLYAGAMQLSLHEAITLKAFGLIATRLPDGSRGYSLIVFITAEDFRPIPLGLGFTLLGIGGMVGVHRTFDQDVLREGLKSGLLATLLFPPDPVGNAPTLIRNLASAFPARRGSYLLGLLVEIGWFTPTLVHLDLALILEFGARTRLLALGRISALLPSADNDLVRLNMEAMGVLDFDASTAAVDAVLVDSRLAQKFVITGSAALRAGFGSGPSFVLSVGGFNPHFAPPAGVPALERVGLALSSGDNPRLLCEAYFAITSNTLQFGARASLYAGAGSFSVDGDVGFDVLVQLAPLHFIAEFHAQLQLKYGSSTLFMVSLAGALDGPRPLVVSGKATFEIFWCDFSVQFNTTLVDGEPPPDPLAVNVLTQLTQALVAPASWRTERSATETHGVALRSLPPTSAAAPLVVDPLGQLLVMQQVVPLNTARDIDTFGGAPVAGVRHFALTAAFTVTPTKSLVSVARQAAFAPAQFFVMSEDDKLVAPSFEAMDAGGVFGDAQLVFDPHQVVPAPLEYVSVAITLAGSSPPDPVAAAPYTLIVSQLQAFTRSGAAARAPVRCVGRARFRNDAVKGAACLTPPQWTIVPTGEGPATPVDPAVRTWSDYRGALTVLNRAGARWQLVPAHELDA